MGTALELLENFLGVAPFLNFCGIHYLWREYGIIYGERFGGTILCREICGKTMERDL